MDSPQKRIWMLSHLLPVKATTASPPTPFPDAVQLVGIWTLSQACGFLGTFTLTCAVDHYYHVPGGQCVEGEDLIWRMYRVALQAAAVALALLLPGRHRRLRHALAYLALAAAIVDDYMMVTSTVCSALAPEPYLFAWVRCTVTTVVLAAGDLFIFLGLLLSMVHGSED